MRPCRLLPLAVATGAVFSVPTASAQEVVARGLASTPIAAHGGRVAYSVRDGMGGFALVTRAGGVTARVPIASRPIPFDVDLGPDARLQTVAVYSRCDVEPEFSPSYPVYDGRGCDLYKYDFAAGRESRLAAASSPTASEYWPSIWVDKVAFGRTYDFRRDLAYLYVKELDSRAPSRRQPGGPRRRCGDLGSGRRCSDPGDSAPLELELRGRQLAFTWRFRGTSEGLIYDMRVDTLGTGHQLIDRTGTVGGTALGWPAFDRSRLYWVRSCSRNSGCRGLERRDLNSGVEAEANAPSRITMSHDRDGGRTYVLVGEDFTDCQGDPPPQGVDGTCELLALTPSYRERRSPARERAASRRPSRASAGQRASAHGPQAGAP